MPAPKDLIAPGLGFTPGSVEYIVTRGLSAGAAGAHPVLRITHLGPHGVSLARYGSFADKAPPTAGGPHPVGLITRLGPHAVTMMRYGTFAGKEEGEEEAPARHHIAAIARRRRRGKC